MHRRCGRKSQAAGRHRHPFSWIVVFLLPFVGCGDTALPDLQHAPDAPAERVSVDSTGNLHSESVRLKDLRGEARGLLILSFYGPHCPVCRQLEPELNEVLRQHPDSMILLRINAELSSTEELLRYFGVRRLPHLRVFMNGRPTDVLHGYRTAAQLSERLHSSLD